MIDKEKLKDLKDLDGKEIDACLKEVQAFRDDICLRYDIRAVFITMMGCNANIATILHSLGIYTPSTLVYLFMEPLRKALDADIDVQFTEMPEKEGLN